VERYEEPVDAIEPPDPIEALRYHMESRGMSAVNGNRGTVSIRTIPMTDKRP
jgi:antitoxin component HigA of HigAB toxin-antitoxin module